MAVLKLMHVALRALFSRPREGHMRGDKYMSSSRALLAKQLALGKPTRRRQTAPTFMPIGSTVCAHHDDALAHMLHKRG